MFDQFRCLWVYNFLFCSLLFAFRYFLWPGSTWPSGCLETVFSARVDTLG